MAALAHETAGAGDPLVLLHGITECRRTWEPLVPALAAAHTVLLVDLPGHGESGPAPAYDPVTMAGEVAAVVAEVGLDPPIVVGHSLGGMVATAYAAFHPCRGVLNVDQPLSLAGFQSALREVEPALRGDEATFEAALDAIFESMLGDLRGPAADRVQSCRRPDQDLVLAIWDPVLTSPSADLEALVAALGSQVTVPYLSLHGIDPGDQYTDWLAGVIPHAVVEVWPEVGHYPHLVLPARFAERLTAFERAR